jgi:hypothetical protein
VAAECTPFEDETTHRCYALVKTPDVTWDGANMACQAWGGALAVLATQDEIDAILPSLSSIGGAFWIGAHDLAMEGSFAWQNGEPWMYENGQAPWANSTEPNGGINENCVELYQDGRFNDQACTDLRDHVCERAPAGTLPPN